MWKMVRNLDVILLHMVITENIRLQDILSINVDAVGILVGSNICGGKKLIKMC